MGEKEVLLSLEGLKKMEQELDHLKSVRRREVAERIKQAREFGDISENSEYEDAKNEQAFIEGRILTLEKTLRNAKVLDESELDSEVIRLGSTVRIKDLEFQDEVQYTLVSSMEADPSHHKISDESPVGKALLGQKPGVTIEVDAPAGTLRYQVIEIVR